MNKLRRLNFAILSLLLVTNMAIFAYEPGGAGIDIKSIATTVKPCQDFYQFANGNWLEQNPIPADRTSWGAGSELYEKNLAVLHQILEDAAKDTNAPKGSVTRKVGDLYRVGMDEAKIESEGAAYDAIGSIIGHELTHGFDDQGRQFDADGNLKNWWTPEDEKNYNDYVAIDALHINGKLTMGENIADLGGLKIAYLALQKSREGKPRPEKIDGYTAEQRFFLAFAQGWL